MPGLSPPSAATLTSWNIRERGVRDGSSPTERFEIDSATAERTFLCAWEHRHDVVAYFLGQSALYANGGTTKLSRLPAIAHPDRPGLIATKCVNLRGHKWEGSKLAPIGYVPPPPPPPGAPVSIPYHNPPLPPYQWTAGQINVFHDCEFTVLYESVPYTQATDAEVELDGGSELGRYVSTDSYEVAGEYLSLPQSVFAYLRSSGNVPPHDESIQAAPGKVVPSSIVSVTWHRLPQDVWEPGSYLFEKVFGDSEGEAPYLGTINKDESLGFPTGTLLFAGIRPVRRRSPLGDGYEWDLTFEFNYKPSGHNWAYYQSRVNPILSGYYFIGLKGGTVQTADVLTDGASIYNARPFADLFKVG